MHLRTIAMFCMWNGFRKILKKKQMHRPHMYFAKDIYDCDSHVKCTKLLIVNSFSIYNDIKFPTYFLHPE